ncbi:DNA repair protein RadC [Porticoccaceae bacterium]|jgi:DNA repair protein RadC|nr:DNA repair protein RadC [Porticoccaceae bacterium]MDA7696619.1 DNA repair protein RadC [Porticoccaceae bacterium]MDA8598623.1 DNA repair protein RadC [Porticoccaceae bacterium]MDA9583168.1 DNA repair protein RadC [Porticoccaceae bacterium]MDB2394981.1 DNA repair protein RadC [Porticoccaceae bacterium]
MAIRQWPKDQRPREKLLLKGATALTDAKLLAIFLRTRLPGLSAIDLANQLLDRFGGIGPLLKADQNSFSSAKGLGPAKYCQLQVTLELTHRYLNEQLNDGSVFTSPKQVEDYLSIQKRDYQREVFSVLLLDSKHQLLGYHELFQGSINEISVHPREVVKLALGKNATAVIVAHNHPSGVAELSLSDIAITHNLRSALGLIDIPLLDHFIIGIGEVTSLVE